MSEKENPEVIQGRLGWERGEIYEYKTGGVQIVKVTDVTLGET